MTKSPMTQRQESLILSLARKLDGGSYRFVEQASHLLPVSRTAARGLTRTDASLCIDHLQAEVDKLTAAKDAAERGETTDQPAPTPAPEGGPTAEQLIAMLGKQVSLTFPLKSSGEVVTWSGLCRRIEASDLDGTPAIDIMESSGRTRSVRAHRLTSWAVS